MPSTCHIDIETFSLSDLRQAGMYVYSEHPSTEIMVLCYAFNNGPVNTWVPYDDVPESIVVPMMEFHAKRGGKFTASLDIPTKLGVTLSYLNYISSGFVLHLIAGILLFINIYFARLRRQIEFERYVKTHSRWQY